MKKILIWSITAALAGFLFGFDTVVISGAEKKLQAIWHSSDVFHGVVVIGMALWGTVVGALLGGIPTNKIGRKKTLIWIGILYTVSALGSAFANDPITFATFRFIGGLGVGASTIAAPAYISEIAPAKDRGKLVGLYQFNIVFGILVAFLSNYLLSGLWENAWRWMVGVEAIPAFIYTLFAFSIPKSPRWLLTKLRNDEARRVLKVIDPAKDVEKLMLEINAERINAANGENIFMKKYRFPLLLAFLIAFFNQLSGINAFLYYAPRILIEAGLEESSALIGSIGVGLANLIFTLLGIYLIDRLGRKQLMYYGSIGYIISLTLVSLAFFLNWGGLTMPILLFMFIGAHAIGQGTVIWVFISEIFPNHLRGAGQSFGCSVHWILAAVVPSLVPVLFTAVGPGNVFAFFAFMMVLQLLFVAFMMPETKGISLEKLSAQLSRSRVKPKALGILILIGAISITSCKRTAEKNLDLADKRTEVTRDSKVEKYRPTFHFTPKANWMNDPNGMVYHDGEYHLFYQYYPDSTVWGPMHWGHAKSMDLLHWEHRPIALYPDDLGYIFSGSAVIDKDNTAGFGENAMVAIYTYHDPVKEKKGRDDFQTQGIAYSLDKGETWTKYSGNPVIHNPGIRDFRDPKVFWNEGKSVWQMVLVAKDHIQFFESPNLRDWSKISVFRFENGEKLGVWECPDLIQLPVEGTEEPKWVLILSHGDGAPNGGSGTRYFVGDYDGITFTTDQSESQWIDYGTDNYAGVTWSNEPKGRSLFIGWMSNWDYATTTPTKSWRSAMTLPRVLSLKKQGNRYLLKSKTIPEFAKLTEKIEPRGTIEDNAVSIQYDGLQTSVISFDVELQDELQMVLFNEHGDHYRIGYNPVDGIFHVDRRKSGLVDFNEKFTKVPQQSISLGENKLTSIKIVLDASSIEFFLNGGEYVMTNQVFPKKEYTHFEIGPMENSKVKNLEIELVKSVLQ